MVVSDIPASIWAALSGAIGGIGSWWLAVRTLRATIERDQAALALKAHEVQTADQATFRAALMTDVGELRELIRQCEADRATLHRQVSATEAQIAVLKASNEIMEKWVVFFKNGQIGVIAAPPLSEPAT